jgi:metallo-beta-lactamase class B
MKIQIALACVVILLVNSCSTPTVVDNYESERLKIERISAHTFQHISYLDTEAYGKVACNGMIVAVDGEAVIFDTPSYDQDAQELIQWVEEELNCQIIGVVATHFHIDCLGSLDEFHAQQIPSYANDLTIELAKADEGNLPEIGFEKAIELKVGGRPLIVDFLGAGHTYDNVIGYFPQDKALFGGCLIKSTGAGKGNVADADVTAWPLTVAQVKTAYPDAEIIIPGHGKRGGQELLDYTIQLFAEE